VRGVDPVQRVDAAAVSPPVMIGGEVVQIMILLRDVIYNFGYCKALYFA
jgi:hypothetical protein